MTNMFKKVIAGLISVASLTTCIFGMSANATDGYTSGMSNGIGSLSVTSSFASASTRSVPDTKYQYLYVSIDKVNGSSISGYVSASDYKTNVSVTVMGTYNNANSTHKTSTSNEYGLYVIR